MGDGVSARQRVTAFWDEAVRGWLDSSPLDVRLQQWQAAYSGRGDGAVQADAMPEPFIGPFATGRDPAMVMLGLKPGGADLTFQGKGGVFTDAVGRVGYTEWASSAPYTSEAWEGTHGRNRYHRSRAAFASRFLAADVTPADLLYVELFPWHSIKVTGSMHPTPAVLAEFVWEPLAECDVAQVFAFGAPWLTSGAAVSTAPGRELQVSWRSGGRSAHVFPLPSGQDLIVVKQSGYAGPPGAHDTEALREALG
ncbi:hypothetical protein [Curtobacterium sp. MCBD17_008]|uniref:anti-phage DNA glycosylase Brig1 n=1 Tax=Curtobacterium sp. MCBD17_008 TaxID=2175656 RepID=UPI000DAA42CA|nr:hypothetical protein [Curtobacterium sp. MCBD17_008]PZE92891.1 hypothetical protein DEI95_07995 [Curtobacterium sp. MCBD17_008]